MPFSGTGTFTLVSGNPVVTGTNISSTVQNNTMSDFANGFTNCITRDGQSPPISNLPMGNQRHTGAGAASGTGEYLVYGQNGAVLGTLTASAVTTTGNVTVGGNFQANGTSSVASLTVGPGVVDFAAVPIGKVTSGTYTPTLTNVTNVAASTPRQCQWLRVGNTVTVGGQLDFSCTGVADSELGISLPLASNFTTAYQAGGCAQSFETAVNSGQTFVIQADATTNRAQVKWRAARTPTQLMTFTFTYEVL